jgi:23S rRNA pseudouridine1911/1915/1917 synthase
MREKKFTRRYIALVRGQIENQEIRSILVRDRGDGRRGSSVKDPDGELAVTHVKKIVKYKFPFGELH